MSAKQPTIKEIAKRLNISISTVSRALHDHPSIGLRTKTRVKELASELMYEHVFKVGASIAVLLKNKELEVAA